MRVCLYCMHKFRRIFMKRQIIVFSLLMLTSSLMAQVKYSNEFLNIGVGARTMGMAGAGIALVDDVTAGYWNPSALVGLQSDLDISLMHSEYFAGLAKYDYGAVAKRIDSESVVALSMIRLGVDDIPNTLELIDSDGNILYDRIKTFSAADMGFVFSYARKTPIEGLSIGGNAKIIYRRTGEFANAWGFGFDASATWIKNDWRLAAMARDITTSFNAWRIQTDKLEEIFALTGNEIPKNSLEITMPRIILGVGRSFKVSDDIIASADLDLHFTLDGKRPVLLSLGFTGIDPYLGTEWIYKNWLSLRMGVGQFQWVPGFEGNNELNLQPALGLGVRFKNLHINYALTDVGDMSISQYSNIISLRFSLNT